MRLQFCDVLSLWTFLALDNFEFNVIAFLQALVALGLDGAIVDEHIRPVIATDESEAFCVVEPFHFTFVTSHVPYSTDHAGNETARTTLILIFVI